METTALETVETVTELGPSIINKKGLIIAGGVALLAAVGYGIYRLIKARKEKEVTVTHLHVVKDEELDEE